MDGLRCNRGAGQRRDRERSVRGDRGHGRRQPRNARGAERSGGVSVGHSGWLWGTPQPQGNALHGIDFAGSRGYAAGDFGTLLRTDDGGETWEGLPTGITAPLVTVRVVDSNTVVIGGDCALRRSDDGGQTFTRLPWTSSDQNCPSEIASFSFPSASVGYVMTQDGSILRTNDGGATFARKTSVPGTDSAGGSRTPTDIFFTADNSGVVTTSGDGPGKIFRTNDGGNSWTEVQSAPDGPGGAIQQFSAARLRGWSGIRGRQRKDAPEDRGRRRKLDAEAA